MDKEFSYKPNATYPLNIAGSGGAFTSNQQCDFKINAKGKKIVRKTLALNGTLKIVDGNGNTPSASSQVWLSPSAGLHGIISNLITITEKKGTVENILNYGRYVAMHKFSTTIETMRGEVARAMHGIFPNDNTVLAQQFAMGDNDGNINFSLPLEFCLNHSHDVNTGEECDIPYSMLGSDSSPLQITMRFSPANQSIFGADASNYSIEIYNLMVVWDEVNDDGHNPAIAMKVLNFTRNTINSQYYSINCFLPIPSSGLMVSFIAIASEADQTQDYYQIQALPRNASGQGTQSLELLLDDTQRVFKYRLAQSDQERLYSNMLMQGTTTTSLTRADFYESKIGEMYSLMFPTLITGHKVSVVLYNPNIISTAGFNAYAFYLGLVEL